MRTSAQSATQMQGAKRRLQGATWISPQYTHRGDVKNSQGKNHGALGSCHGEQEGKRKEPHGETGRAVPQGRRPMRIVKS